MASTQTVFVFCQKGGIFMSSDTPTINMAATGANIKALIKNKGLKVADVQIRCGFNTPQAIFQMDARRCNAFDRQYGDSCAYSRYAH